MCTCMCAFKSFAVEGVEQLLQQASLTPNKFSVYKPVWQRRRKQHNRQITLVRNVEPEGISVKQLTGTTESISIQPERNSVKYLGLVQQFRICTNAPHLYSLLKEHGETMNAKSVGAAAAAFANMARKPVAAQQLWNLQKVFKVLMVMMEEQLVNMSIRDATNCLWALSKGVQVLPWKVIQPYHYMFKKLSNLVIYLIDPEATKVLEESKTGRWLIYYQICRQPTHLIVSKLRNVFFNILLFSKQEFET
eukprot:TRINITY_DN11562_c0_g2_i1.p1 TRINITY_DN11562_c0_g2~~TRINITY_DN11562_c0_g2_i1.p1  ORF type:complete len:249 (+),score=9.87 TRINITY_DN11562_c0_g2_i1:56-802(+)